MDRDTRFETPQSRLAKLACFAQFANVTRWLCRTRDLVAGAETYTLDAFRQSLAELQQGFLDAELDLCISLYRFGDTIKEKQNANNEEREG